ncbi:YchJ family metal-binding protein [Dasania marina]|uniref:YchJ family protein n=1 Tax=Dasania marina TaxID=471499 RepID=UPI0030D8EEEB|tara:strand:+ start:82712 stop:83203 length:492 start_codon:yes stop_codon:yes gene_type:complete
MNTATPLCLCGSKKNFADCCQPLLIGEQQAQTAEQLMRSRYSAFCKHDVDYLIATHHPSKREDDDKEQLRQTLASCRWLRLQIVQSQQGQANDDSGTVEFIAEYQENKQLFQLCEKSSFIKEDGRWYYLDGAVSNSHQAQPVKLGRNDPCWCGSGKKHKKCHG